MKRVNISREFYCDEDDDPIAKIDEWLFEILRIHDNPSSEFKIEFVETVLQKKG
jgi:hypothetical protein